MFPLYRIYRFSQKENKPYKHIQLNRGPLHYVETEKREPVPHENRLEESLSRTRRIVRDTVLCNDFSLFCTFTFSPDKVPDRTDYDSLKKSLGKL